MALEQQERLLPYEQRAIAKFYLKDFYGLETVTLAEVLWDNNGRRRGELLNLEAQLCPEVAVDRTVKAVEKQASWNQGICPWDLSGAELRRKLREALGLNDFLDPEREWTKYDLVDYTTRIRKQAVLV